MVPRQRYGPLSVQRPFYPEGACCHTYLLHPPGGVVGGDHLEIDINTQSGAHGLVTTPGAGKFYLSAGDTAQVKQSLTVGADSRFEYLPQENIYFPGARVHSRTDINVDDNSGLVLWEKHCFGRPANHESFSEGEVTTELHLRRHGSLLFSEKQRVDHDEIERASGFRGNAVAATLLVYGTKLSSDLLQALREQVPESALSGISMPEDELLLVRCLGNNTAAINAYFIRLWQLLRPALFELPACSPRIWNT